MLANFFVKCIKNGERRCYTSKEQENLKDVKTVSKRMQTAAKQRKTVVKPYSKVIEKGTEMGEK